MTTNLANLDTFTRATPDRVMTFKGMRPVVRAEAFPPGLHPDKCPLVKDCTAVRLTTDTGEVRWYGVERSWIDSHLRMVVNGFPAGFEEMQRWKKVGDA